MKSSRVEVRSARHLRLNGPLLLPTSCLSVQTRHSVVVLFLVFLFLFVLMLAEAADAVFSVRVGRDPKTTLLAFHGLILRGQVDAFTLLSVHAVLMAALGEVTRTSRELGFDGGIGRDPIGEGIFTILDNTAYADVSNVCCNKIKEDSYALLASYPS